MKRICQNCRFSKHEDKGYPTDTTCQRYPPVGVIRATQPLVAVEGTCGEFKPKTSLIIRILTSIFDALPPRTSSQ